MKTFWFVSAPLAGHTDWGGMLRTACALAEAGHSVRWLSEAALAPLIANAGLPFTAIDESGWLWPPPPLPDVRAMPPVEAMFLRYRRALDTWLSEERVAPAVEALCQAADRLGAPDVLVTDPFLSACALAAEKMAVPLAVAGWPAGQPLDEDRLYAVQADLSKISRERIDRLLARFGLRGENFSAGAAPAVESAHLHLSYFSRAWYQAEPDFLPQTQFVGGTPQPPRTPQPEWLAQIAPDAPLALITLGSVFTGDLGFFAWAAQAAARLRMVPVVVLGNNPIRAEDKAALKAALPPGTRLLNWIDYDHVFPRLAVIIHHGGMGTTHRAAVQGVPQVVVPHAADQRGQARRVAQAKVGLNLSAHDVRNGQLLPAIRAVTTDASVLANARALAADLAALGGPTQAAALLLALAERVGARHGQ
jgi:MGT family glycosyltransferase